MATEPDLDEGFYGLKLAYTGGGSPTNSRADLFDGENGSEYSSEVEEQLLRIYSKCQDCEEPDSPVKGSAPNARDLPIHNPHAYPCKNTDDVLPTPPNQWPQSPVMLRPTPNLSNLTKIRGIRYCGASEYQHFPGFCAGCILPINTGAEAPGKSLVIDFESKYFVGTLLMRIKESPPAEAEHQMATSYFDGKKRRFQAVVRGKFKTPLPMSECITGQEFSRPGGKLPAKWIVSSFIKFVSTLAPQLEATIDGNNPRFISPLVATAHTVLERETEDGVDYSKAAGDKEEKEQLTNFSIYAGSKDIEESVEELPATDPQSVMGRAMEKPPSNATSSIAARQKARKKAFNALSAKKAKEPTFDLSKEYTFEFYQHLLLFGDALAIDMGRPIGKVGIASCTDGQPIKFMAAHKQPDGSLEPLWSFDIWHASLFPYAEAYHKSN